MSGVLDGIIDVNDPASYPAIEPARRFFSCFFVTFPFLSRRAAPSSVASPTVNRRKAAQSSTHAAAQRENFYGRTFLVVLSGQAAGQPNVSHQGGLQVIG